MRTCFRKNEVYLCPIMEKTMPWEERPEGCGKPLWRFSGNPVIPRDLLPDSNSIV